MTTEAMEHTTLTITRYTGEKVLLRSGKFGPAASTTFDITGSIQPFAGISIKILPEGTKSDDARLIFTDTMLNTTSQFTKVQADTTVISGLTYVCHKSENWSDLGLESDHIMAVFVRSDQ